MEDKKYYKYTYTLGTSVVKIVEMEYYDNEELDNAKVFIDNLGTWEFYMYSESNKNQGMFFQQISHRLLEDYRAASRLAETAHGRFTTFNRLWRGLEP